MLLKGFVQPKQGGGGQEGYQSIRVDFVHNHKCFLGTLKGLLQCFKFQKTSLGPFLMWSELPKTQKHVVTQRYSPCDVTPTAAVPLLLLIALLICKNILFCFLTPLFGARPQWNSTCHYSYGAPAGGVLVHGCSSRQLRSSEFFVAHSKYNKKNCTFFRP